MLRSESHRLNVNCPHAREVSTWDLEQGNRQRRNQPLDVNRHTTPWSHWRKCPFPLMEDRSLLDCTWGPFKPMNWDAWILLTLAHYQQAFQFLFVLRKWLFAMQTPFNKTFPLILSLKFRPGNGGGHTPPKKKGFVKISTPFKTNYTRQHHTGCRHSQCS